ncbi:MAG TPA: hypothetical protein VM662_02055 [Sphingomonas sp.]|nr:hypothetical protein [Sphingomonas sp.]
MAFAVAVTLAGTVHAQTLVSGAPVPTHSYAEVQALKVPVVDGDVTDRPYRVIGDIEAGVRKATLFSKSPSPEKVYRELWERGKKMGADAVINASYGESRVTALSWGSRKARGKAIKFLTDAEIAARDAAAPAAPEQAPGSAN